MKKFGGKVEYNYTLFRNYISTVNSDYLPLIVRLGLDKDVESILRCCLYNFTDLVNDQIRMKMEQKVKQFLQGEELCICALLPSGKIQYYKKDNLESEIIRNNNLYEKIPIYSEDKPWENPTPLQYQILEEVKSVDIDKERVKVKRSNKRLGDKPVTGERIAWYLMIKKYYVTFSKELGENIQFNENKLVPMSKRMRDVIEMFKESLFYKREKGLCISDAKFLSKYEKLTAGNLKVLYARHKTAATAVNRFFSGTEITDDLLRKFFLIEDGILKANPRSVNEKDYMIIL